MSVQPPAPPPAPGTLVGSFRIERLLGRGSLGEVYLGADTRRPRRVALRLLPPGFAGDARKRAAFDREVRAAAAIRHPSLCEFYDVGEWRGRLFVEMEFLEGVTLAERIAMSPDVMAVDEALAIGAQIAAALAELHGHHLVHGDLKSVNVFLLSNGQVKVADGGVSKRWIAGDVIDVDGANAYKAPEQTLGREADARTDLFACGVVLYELLTRQVPFVAANEAARLEVIAHEAPRPIARLNPKVPEALARVVGRLLEKDPRQRYPSAQALRADLVRVQSGEALADPALAVAPLAPDRQISWRTIGAVLAAVAFVLAVATMAWLTWETRRISTAGRPAAAAGAAPVTRMSLIVLPADETGSSEPVADLAARELSAMLSRVDAIDVVPPPDAVDVRASGDGPARIAALFGADAFVAPTVTINGEHLVISVVARARDGRTIASIEASGSVSDFVSVLVQTANDLRAALRPSSPVIPKSAASTANSEAWLALAQGEASSAAYETTGGDAALKTAGDAFARALSLDPHLAAAATGLAGLAAIRLDRGAGAAAEARADPARAQSDLERWGRQATDANPADAEAWALRARGATDVDQAFDFALRGAAAATNDARAQLGLVAIGLPARIVVEIGRRAAALDPLAPEPVLVTASALAMLDQSAQALAAVDAAPFPRPDWPPLIIERLGDLADLDRQSAQPSHVADVQRLVAAAGSSAAMPGLDRLVVQYIAAADGGDPNGHALAAEVAAAMASAEGSGDVACRLVSGLAPLLVESGERAAALEIIASGRTRDCLPPYDALTLDHRLDPVRTAPDFRDAVAAAHDRFARLLALIDRARRQGRWPAYLEGATAAVAALAGPTSPKAP